MSAKIKTGIVGFGYMGEIRYRNIMEHPDMELAGICDQFFGDLRVCHGKIEGMYLVSLNTRSYNGVIGRLIFLKDEFEFGIHSAKLYTTLLSR